MINRLKETVCKANLDLVKHGLVIFTWGNVSGVDRENNLIVIKPSGISYDDLSPEDMTVVNFDGEVVQGRHRPSSDTATHIELYKSFPNIGGVAHTHSTYATAFAQATRGISPYGTTHADYFYAEVPCTRALTEREVKTDYEKNTGLVIAETFKSLDYGSIPGVLVASHGPFSWGLSPDEAVYNAVVLEEISKMASLTKQLNPDIKAINQYILDKHYLRKHGKDAYYGQV